MRNIIDDTLIYCQTYFFLGFFLDNSIHTMQDLQQESESLFEAAPSYLSSGQQAAARAEWNANPKALPPMTLYLGSWEPEGFLKRSA